MAVLTARELETIPSAVAPCEPQTMAVLSGCYGDCLTRAATKCRARIVSAEVTCNGDKNCEACVVDSYWDCAGGCAWWNRLLDAAVKILGRAVAL